MGKKDWILKYKICMKFRPVCRDKSQHRAEHPERKITMKETLSAKSCLSNLTPHNKIRALKCIFNQIKLHLT